MLNSFNMISIRIARINKFHNDLLRASFDSFLLIKNSRAFQLVTRRAHVLFPLLTTLKSIGKTQLHVYTG